MKRILLLAVLACPNAWSASETCCVDKDIAAAFLQNLKFGRDWPEGFPVEFDSAEVEFIGTRVQLRGHSTGVAWKSKLDPQATLALVSDLLATQRWLAIPANDRPGAVRERGFVSYQSSSIDDHRQFCRASDGTLSVQARAAEIGTVLTVWHDSSSRARDCAHLVAMPQAASRYDEMLTYLPTLVLPEGIDAHASGGSGAANDSVHSSLSAQTSVPASEIIEHFEPQMAQQGWSLDTRFHGSTGSGHLWRRESGSLRLSCIVTAVGDGERLQLLVNVALL